MATGDLYQDRKASVPGSEAEDRERLVVTEAEVVQLQARVRELAVAREASGERLEALESRVAATVGRLNELDRALENRVDRVQAAVDAHSRVLSEGGGPERYPALARDVATLKGRVGDHQRVLAGLTDTRATVSWVQDVFGGLGGRVRRLEGLLGVEARRGEVVVEDRESPRGPSGVGGVFRVDPEEVRGRSASALMAALGCDRGDQAGPGRVKTPGGWLRAVARELEDFPGSAFGVDGAERAKMVSTSWATRIASRLRLLAGWLDGGSEGSLPETAPRTRSGKRKRSPAEGSAGQPSLEAEPMRISEGGDSHDSEGRTLPHSWLGERL